MSYDGRTFVTRKITRALANIKLGLQECLYLGNLDALRDWGHARDYVEAMWLMLQQEKPDDFVIATGEQHSVRDFVNAVASEMELDLQWKGSGSDEKAVDPHGIVRVAIDPRYFRPAEVENLLGDGAKAKRDLGWSPRTKFSDLVKEMVEADLQEARQTQLVRQHGFTSLARHE